VNLIYPRFPLNRWPAMLGVAAIGALIAGSYGIVHDQITYTISPEYFTRLKFEQFKWANRGWPTRAFVGEIGFLASPASSHRTLSRAACSRSRCAASPSSSAVRWPLPSSDFSTA
jgi:hypothetical protein